MDAQRILNAFSEFVPATPGGIGIVNDVPPVPLTNTDPNPTLLNSTASLDTMDTSISSLLALLLSLAVRNMDVLKLMLIGGVIETSRRLVFTLWSQLWTWISTSWHVTVHFESHDEVYHWMMFWLGNQSVWESSREMYITTAYSYTDQDAADDFQSGKQLKYLPIYNMPSWFTYKGAWISVTRQRNERANTPNPTETLILSRKHDLLRDILKEAKEQSSSADIINIFSAGNYNEWYRASSRRKRPLRSVILEPEVKNAVLADAVDFLSNEEWYIERGIPYRRGYLLHGVPGSGKTSLIHSIAGELTLDVYIVSLSKPGLDDSQLNGLFCAMPSRSILLIEDIDAVFRRVTAARKAVTSKPDESNEEKTKNDIKGSFPFNPQGNENMNGVTLSGLLNALDGIAASEGRLLFATTNCVTALDEALSRPGRMDVHVEFKNATKWQARELFWSFYEPRTKRKEKNNNYKDPMLISAAVKFATSTVPEPVKLDELAKLADQFEESIPADVFSVASLQGYLMLYKERPQSAIKGIEKWVVEEMTKKNIKEKVEKEEEGEDDGEDDEQGWEEQPSGGVPFAVGDFIFLGEEEEGGEDEDLGEDLIRFIIEHPV
ncbi:hypothetical protein Clacol_001202 [Clathrus columnatus]|uniref:P-loop containing nucleoside triphosphate hydrolase protein n=1 Tax=Clathrus columnatus TaxID=1419009 RepID=A0AAV4ZXU9_9AGAM|nr:hypothetical protein Clacol_001202 [Clathrus columnatus]